MGKDIGKAGSTSESTTETDRGIPNIAASGNTKRAATKSTSNGGRGRGGSGGTGETEEKESPIISLVETPELDDKELEKRRKRAEAQKQRRIKAKEKKDGVTAKPKSKADPTQIKILLSTVSMIAASKEGMEEWALSEVEIDQIAKPLANILSKYEGISNISTEYADHLALVIAAFTIFFPRILVTLQKRKNKKPKEVKVNARNNQQRTVATAEQHTNGAIESGSRSSDRKSTTSAPNVGQELSDLLSPSPIF